MSILSCGVSFRLPIVSNCNSEASSNRKSRNRSGGIFYLNRNLSTDGLEFGSSRGKDAKRSNDVRLKSAVDVVGAVESSAAGEGERSFYDAIVIGSGIGGLVAATQLAVKGAKVLVLEKYVIPGGSSGFYERDGFKFDVGSSVMFGFSDKVCCFRIRFTFECAINLHCFC